MNVLPAAFLANSMAPLSLLAKMSITMAWTLDLKLLTSFTSLRAKEGNSAWEAMQQFQPLWVSPTHLLYVVLAWTSSVMVATE